MTRLIVDSRESQSGLIAMLRFGGAEVVVEELECGDYVLAEGMAVERKTSEDFVGSIVDRRLFTQIALLKATYERAYILIEGDVFGCLPNIYAQGLSLESLMGAISYISVIEGIPVVTTSNAAQSAMMLLTMQRHALGGLGYEVPLRVAKPKNRNSQAQYLVEGLPRIGPAAAKRLLAHFGSAKAVFTATASELKAVHGIGPKTIKTIQEVLEHNI